VENSLFTKEYGTLRKRLRQARQDAGLSQQHLADRLSPSTGLSAVNALKHKQKMQRFVSRCETGERRLDPYECYVLCNALDMDFLGLMQSLVKEWEQCDEGSENSKTDAHH